MHPPYALAALTLVALTTAPAGSAQPNTVSAYVVQSRLTAFGHVAEGGGLAYDRDLAPWLALSADVQLVRTAETDPITLLVLSSADWHERTQAAAGVNALAFPIRFGALGAAHRFGLSVGAAARWKDERFHVAGFNGTFPADTPQPRLDMLTQMITEWEARGPDYEAVVFDHPGGGAERYPGVSPTVFAPGLAVAFTQRHRATDYGLSAGLAYELRHGRTVVGARAAYRRYRDQRLIIGSHALDLSLRVGYRF